MKLTKIELETQINFNEEENQASIETANRALIHRLDKLCEKRPEITVVRETENFKTYNCPKKWVKVVAPRLLSEKKRSELSERAKRNLAKRKEV